MIAKKIIVTTGEKKKINVRAVETPEPTIVSDPWQKAKSVAGAAETKIESKLGRSRRKVVAFWLIILAIVVFGGFKLYGYTHRPNSPLSENIKSNLTFSPYIIDKNNTRYYTYNYRTTNAEGQAKILSFDITTPDGITVALSEYAEPPQLSQGDNKAQFLSNIIKEYTKIDTKNGTIYLGQPAATGNKQIAALIERNLLILMSPSTNMGDSQWQQLGNQFVLENL